MILNSYLIYLVIYILGRGHFETYNPLQRGWVRAPFPGRSSAGDERPGFGSGRAGRVSFSSIGPGQVEPGAKHEVLRTSYIKGQDGQAVDLVSNFFKILMNAITFYHYDLYIAFEKQIINLRNLQLEDPTAELSSANGKDQKFIMRFAEDILKKFVSQNQTYFNSISFVFDGFKNIYTMAKILMPGKLLRSRVDLKIGGRIRNFMVKLELVDTIDSKVVEQFYEQKMDVEIEQKVITAYEIFFKHLMAEQYEQFQRKFFDLETTGGGQRGKLVEYVSGFYNSVRPTEFGLAMNIHLKTTCVVSREVNSLCDLACLVLNLGDADLAKFEFQPRHLGQLNRIARHLKVYTDHMKDNSRLIYQIDQIVNKTPQQLTFKRSDYQTKQFVTITVADYFMSEYKIRLKNLPMVKTTGKNARYLPMELCKMPKCQFLNSNKLGADIQSQLLHRSTHMPDVYFEKVNNLVKKATKMNPELYDAFKLKLTDKPVAITGRVLDSPALLPSRPRGPFHNPISGANMAIFGLSSSVNERQLTDFSNEMIYQAKEFGFIEFQFCYIKAVDLKTLGDLKNLVVNIWKMMPKIDLVFFGIPTSKISMLMLFKL